MHKLISALLLVSPASAGTSDCVGKGDNSAKCFIDHLYDEPGPMSGNYAGADVMFLGKATCVTPESQWKFIVARDAAGKVIVPLNMVVIAALSGRYPEAARFLDNVVIKKEVDAAFTGAELAAFEVPTCGELPLTGLANPAIPQTGGCVGKGDNSAKCVTNRIYDEPGPTSGSNLTLGALV
jgi:hypothetical protein